MYYSDVRDDYVRFWDLDQSMSMRIGFWDERVNSVPEALARTDAFLAEEVGIRDTDYVLDVGCGVGGSAIRLAREYGCRVLGINVSPQQIGEARRNAKRHNVAHLVKFAVQDFHAIDLQDEQFDVVWAVESLSHSADQYLALREWTRLLKPGGRIIGADYFRSRDRFSASTEALRQTVLGGLCFHEFEYAQRFDCMLETLDLRQIQFFDVTHNVLPSSRRLNQMSWFGVALGGLLKRLGLRSESQNRLVRANRTQYEALSSGIHQYRIFAAQKPEYVSEFPNRTEGRAQSPSVNRQPVRDEHDTISI